MNRRVLLIGHPRRPEAYEVAERLVDGLTAAGIEVAGIADELAAFGIAQRPGVVTVAPEEAGVACELAVVLGGDGTILRAAELSRDCGVPLLGINLGHVGFLAEAEKEDVERIVACVRERSWIVETRATLEVVATDGRGEVELHRGWALNEASIEKAARERMLELTVEIDGRPLASWGADGVVIATPTGSTAYAFSAGGPVVWPDTEAILLVPISAHALFARPLVLGPRAQLAVELVPGAQGRAVLWCDGRRPFDLPDGARVEVHASDKPVTLARLSTAPFTDRLVRKFDLSVEGWRGTRRAH
ncbi:NAD kinase [Dermacoccus nishinomiyaensis]